MDLVLVSLAHVWPNHLSFQNELVFNTVSYVISLALGVSLSEAFLHFTDEKAVLSNLYESWPLLESQLPSGNAA